MSKTKSKEERLVEEVYKDYLKRRETRRSLEAQWQLNINFYIGNQYSKILSNNNISSVDKQYFWQEKEVFNHITPSVETRIAKITRLTPEFAILPASTDEADIKSAKLSKDIVSAVSNKINLLSTIKNATTWSEICGTVFYKVLWDNNKGETFATSEGKVIKEGDVCVDVCSPFEIFPDNISCERMEDLKSIIHAKVYDVDTIKTLYGVDVKPEKVNSFTLDSGFGSVGGLGYDSHINKVSNVEMDHHCVLIEKYCMPDTNYPNGRLTIIVADKLLYDGELPYKNGDNGERCFPFIRQISNFVPGSFFGASIIERLIPIQRAYNSMRNRKHEYFNRLAMGVLAVEDGSVDTEALELDGLSPGKVLVYRQGGHAPEIMDTPNINANFEAEEERLLDEFKTISGVSELMTDSYSSYSNMSGTSIQLLIEQDESRVQPCIDSIKQAMVDIAKNILRLYKQFAVLPRLLKLAGDMGDIKLFYWDRSKITSDDVVIDTNSSFNESIATKRTMLLDLIRSGLMYDENGKFTPNMKKKCLDLLGFGVWENTVDLNTLHINKAQEENLTMSKEYISPLEIDDHKLHIDEHIAYILGTEIKRTKNAKEITERIIKHINEHKNMMNK